MSCLGLLYVFLSYLTFFSSSNFLYFLLSELSPLQLVLCDLNWLSTLNGVPKGTFQSGGGVVLPDLEQECTYIWLCLWYMIYHIYACTYVYIYIYISLSISQYTSAVFVVLKHAFVQWNRKKSTKESKLVHHLWCGRFRWSLRRWRSGDRLVLRYEGFLSWLFNRALACEWPSNTS